MRHLNTDYNFISGYKSGSRFFNMTPQWTNFQTSFLNMKLTPNAEDDDTEGGYDYKYSISSRY